MASKGHAFNSELLASVAVAAREVIVGCAEEYESSAGATIATRLHLILKGLQSQPLYQLSPEIQTLSFRALKYLLEICTWPNYPARAEMRPNAQDLYDILVHKFKSDKDQMNKSIKKFLTQKPDAIEPCEQLFVDLADKLKRTDQSVADQSTPYDHHLEPREEDIYPEQVNRGLTDVIKKHSSCNLTSHTVQLQEMIPSPWHHTRICLNNGVRTADELAHIELIIAAEGKKFWLDISLDVSLQLKDNGGDLELDSDPESLGSDDDEPEDEMILMKQGAVCQMLDEPSYCKVRLQLDENHRLHKCLDPEVPEHFTRPGDGVHLSNLLKYGDLNVEHKISLAYAVARACWQFYSSDMMDARWSSNDIWFMPVENQPDNRVPLKAFISFPLGQYSPSPQECFQSGDFYHQYPRILFLGIVLLEIGLGEPLGLEPFDPNTSKHSLIAHTNKAWANAKSRLNEFKKVQWDDFSYKDIFDEAIENCFDSKIFRTKKSAKKRRGRDQSEKPYPNDAIARTLAERRNTLYRKVVAPFFWLANVGFNPSADIQFITMQSMVDRRKSIVADDEKFWQEMKKPTFDSGSTSQIDGWMNQLKDICGYVLRCRKRTKTKTPIRVAILDTGCNTNIPFFQKANISSCLKEWKDFATDSQSHVDNFGHGSFMARLVLQVAPLIDLYIARVADTQDQLEKNEEKVAEALEWAGLNRKVDVISMSFGFPKTSTVISDAIEKVNKQRANSVIFLASAGNSSTDRGEAFPACHRSVISIYATDCQGTYLKSNPTKTRDGRRLIGAYGDSIPTEIVEEVQKFFPQGDFSPGTSIATAITAGIAAIMLSYVAALPALLHFPPTFDDFERLKTGEGMASMLREMAIDRDHQGDFINPIGFWGERSKDKEMFLAICKAVSGIRPR